MNTGTGNTKKEDESMVREKEEDTHMNKKTEAEICRQGYNRKRSTIKTKRQAVKHNQKVNFV